MTHYSHGSQVSRGKAQNLKKAFLRPIMKKQEPSLPREIATLAGHAVYVYINVK